MPHLPPAQNLSLAVQKNIWEDWENNKANLQAELSNNLGTDWIIDVNPFGIYPYHNDGYVKQWLGTCIKDYFQHAVYQFKFLIKRYVNIKDEINDIAHRHILTLDVEETNPPRFAYGGCDIANGKLRILFEENHLGVNTTNCCNEDNLFRALNTASNDKPMTFYVRLGIHNDYEAKIPAVQRDLTELLNLNEGELTLSPNLEETFVNMQDAVNRGVKTFRDDWEQVFGATICRYFAAAFWQMKYMKFEEDERSREGFLAALTKREIAFRIVDSLQHDSWSECEFVDGIMYVQTTVEYFGMIEVHVPQNY
ncbi:hypothetical protein QBC38DRAFT_455863 [Podospora fimiseda]|uniref:Uncharacterized protein n=1 Tax=Podospora fimiseda TaxID=252190 RepID=A0AAN7BNW0_9PEZI|nr:hypothetical protein QBC38DRAFT_455863 [Podospora fimiseda]